MAAFLASSIVRSRSNLALLLAVARKAVEKVPAELRTPSTALATGQDVDSLLASPGNSRAFKLALGNALSKGLSVDQALKPGLRRPAGRLMQPGHPARTAHLPPARSGE